LIEIKICDSANIEVRTSNLEAAQMRTEKNNRYVSNIQAFSSGEADGNNGATSQG
jgi:hypothetical protein